MQFLNYLATFDLLIDIINLKLYTFFCKMFVKHFFSNLNLKIEHMIPYKWLYLAVKKNLTGFINFFSCFKFVFLLKLENLIQSKILSA